MPRLSITVVGIALFCSTARAQETCNTPVVMPGPSTFSDDTTSAVDDYDPGQFGCTLANAAGPDHIYSYTPAAAELVDITVTPSSPMYDTSLWVFTDCLNPETSCIAGSDEHGPGPAEAVEFLTLTGGTTYFIAVDGFEDFIPNSEPFGPYDLELAVSVVPDGCAAPRAVASMPSLDRLDTSLGTNTFDPTPGCSLPSLPAADLVWRLDPPFNGDATVTVIPLGFDAALYALGDCSQPATSCLTASDAAAIGGPETIALTLTIGTPVWIVVDSRFDSGPFEIVFVAGDSCDERIVIDATPFVTVGDTTATTNTVNMGPSCTGFRTRSNDVFYDIDIGVDSYVDILAEPLDGGYDPALFTFTDCADPEASCVRGADIGVDGEPELLEGFFLASGYTLRVGLDSFIPGETGPYRLTVVEPPDIQVHALDLGVEIELRFAGAIGPTYTVLRDDKSDFSAPTTLSTTAVTGFRDIPGSTLWFYEVE